MNQITRDIYEEFSPWDLDISGWNGNSRIFSKLIRELRPKLIIEVGTWKGQSAIHMAQTLQKEHITGQVICVDTWLGSREFWNGMEHTPERNLFLKHGYPQVYYQFLSNVIHEKVEDYIIPFPATSQIAARVLRAQNRIADLIYIDGSHDEEDVYADIEAYWQLLNSGGVLFGDDFDWRDKSVENAVRNFCERHQQNFSIRGKFWRINKP